MSFVTDACGFQMVSADGRSRRFRGVPSLVASRFRFPAEETVLVLNGEFCFWGIVIPLIRPLCNSSTLRSEREADTMNCENFTFGTIVKAQARKPSPTHSTYLRRVRRGFSDHHFTTGKPTGRVSAVNAPEANGDIPHAERPKRTVHTYWQPQLFRRFLGRGESISSSRKLVSRNIDGSGFEWRTRMLIPRASQSYERFNIRP